MQTFLHIEGISVMGKPTIEMIGFQNNRWTVVSEAKKPTESTATGKFWNCVCECGTNKVVYGVTLRSGASKSCGCLKAERSAINMRKMRLQKCGSLMDRFFSRFVQLANGCWQWRSHTDKDGYGLLPGNGRATRAHRLSYEIHNGKILDGLIICHRCDNPGCVNPDHLFVGTQKDNAQDALKKRRHYVGEKNGRSKLTKEIVKEILHSSLSSQQLADKFGVTKRTINNAKRGKSWKQ